MTEELITTFAYRAQSEVGDTISGTIDAPDIERASQKLADLRLRVFDVQPATRRPRMRALNGDDFLAFNQQLAHLTQAGLPIEHGLRLMAEDARSRGAAETMRQVADELERGTPVAEAFDKYRSRFPMLYGKIIELGIKTTDLPGMLLSLGRHLQPVQRMREAFWRAMAYPIVVLIAAFAVLTFIGIFVLPKFNEIFRDFGTKLPEITVMLLDVARMMPVIAVAFVV